MALQRSSLTKGGPAISVIITTYNEEKNIGACLQNAAWADAIIVVDALAVLIATDDWVGALIVLALIVPAVALSKMFAMT